MVKLRGTLLLQSAESEQAIDGNKRFYSRLSTGFRESSYTV